MASRILIAGSAIDHRRDLRSALEFDGHEVMEAETAERTARQACSDLHDVLILNSVLEGIASYGLCRAIRRKSDLGIIVLGVGSANGAIDALNAGADDFVAAPFVMGELL